jgi:glycosyltransferase involved in cell wall biosynthesis
MNAVSPKVSIVLACRNEEEFLAECLDSILAQTLTEWELLVADDGSDDRTRDILKSYAEKDSRIRLWFFDDQQGPYVRRNFAIGQSHAPFICVHDADDIMTPHKLATLYTHISGDPRLGAVGSWFRVSWYYSDPDIGDCMEFPTQHDHLFQSVLEGV